MLRVTRSDRSCRALPFVISSPPRATIACASSTSTCGKTTSTSTRSPPAWNGRTALKLNDEELPVVAKRLSIEGTEKEILGTLCRRFNLSLIALTMGGEGALLCSPEACSLQPGLPVEVADTVGAGDAFTAALAIGRLKGRDLDTINRHANHVARYACSQPAPRRPCRRNFSTEQSIRHTPCAVFSGGTRSVPDTITLNCRIGIVHLMPEKNDSGHLAGGCGNPAA